MKVELKTWTKENIEELKYVSSHTNRKYLSNSLPNPYTIEDAISWVKMIEEKKNGLYCAIIVDQKYVGNISIIQKSDIFCKDAEIGYLLIEDACGKGLMSEAIKQACKLAFDTLDIVRITGKVMHENIASQKVLEKNGFTLEGRLKDGAYKNNQLYDLILYAKYREVV